MGACATKPKAEGAEGPMPEPEKEDSAGAGLVADSKVEQKAVDLVALDEADRGGFQEIGDDDKVDDQSDRRRSLSHLFRENEEESTAKIESSEKLDLSETVKTTEEVEKKLPEAEQPCITQNKETIADDVVSPETSETVKTIESGVEIVTKEIELEQEKLDSSETVKTTVEVEKKLLEVKQPFTTQNEETTIYMVETCKPAEMEKGVESEPQTVTEQIEQEPKQADSSETVKKTYEAEKNLPEAEQPCTTQNEETVANIVISSDPTEIEKVRESGPETVTEKLEQEQEKIDSSETVKTIEEAEKKLSEIEQLCMTQNEETVTDIVISSKPAQIEKVIESGPETVTLLVETIDKGSDLYLLVSNKDEAEKAAEAAVKVEAQFVEPNEGKVEVVCAPGKPDVKSEEIEVKVVSIEEKN